MLLLWHGCSRLAGVEARAVVQCGTALLKWKPVTKGSLSCDAEVEAGEEGAAVLRRRWAVEVEGALLREKEARLEGGELPG